MINYWIAVDDDLNQDVIAFLTDPQNYSGAVPSSHIGALLKGLPDPMAMLSMFEGYNGKHLYSVYVTDQGVFDMLMGLYPSTVLGKWDMDGVSLQALHPDTVEYMPNEQVEDINLLAGQTPRSFA